MKVIANYKDLEPFLKTGDIILMHGLFPMSQVIEALEWSYWTHSGMVVLAADLGLENCPPVLYWESNSLKNIKDINTNTFKSGPMLVGLEERLKGNKGYYDSAFVLRQLQVERTDTMFENLKDLMPEVSSAIFPNDFDMFYRGMLGRCFNQSVSMDKIYCSELVAMSYIRMGLLPKYRVPNAYEPGDFSIRRRIPLLQRAFLYNQIYIDI
ncbi:MAG: hypothetical protein KDK45_18625 [Leptospiraceae bacterium]|nr:hypothetical protein [Leptospiraceae bacterium]